MNISKLAAGASAVVLVALTAGCSDVLPTAGGVTEVADSDSTLAVDGLEIPSVEVRIGRYVTLPVPASWSRQIDVVGITTWIDLSNADVMTLMSDDSQVADAYVDGYLDGFVDGLAPMEQGDPRTNRQGVDVTVDVYDGGTVAGEPMVVCTLRIEHGDVLAALTMQTSVDCGPLAKAISDGVAPFEADGTIRRRGVDAAAPEPESSATHESTETPSASPSASPSAEPDASAPPNVAPDGWNYRHSLAGFELYSPDGWLVYEEDLRTPGAYFGTWATVDESLVISVNLREDFTAKETATYVESVEWLADSDIVITEQRRGTRDTPLGAVREIRFEADPVDAPPWPSCQNGLVVDGTAVIVTVYGTTGYGDPCDAAALPFEGLVPVPGE